jgi:hypothetical protein
MKRIIQLTLLLGLAACSTQINAQPFPSGLVSWWRGESNIVDSVGTNNGAVYVPLVTLSYIPGQYGQAFGFSGGFVQIPDAADLRPLTNLTVQAWVRSVSPGLFTYIISKSQSVGGAAKSSYGFECGSNNGNILFYVYDGTNRIEAPVTPANVPWDGNWHLATGTYDGSTVRLYLDSIEVGSGTAATNNIDYSNPAPLVFGDFGVGGGNPFSGDVDEVKVFNIAMSASDVVNTYLDPNDSAGTNGLVGWWRAEGNANDSNGTHNGTDGIVTPKPFDFVPGKSDLAMFPHDGGIAIIPDSDSLRPANLTFNVWVRSIAPGDYRYIANKGEVTVAISWGLYTDGTGGLFFLIHNGSTYILSPGAPTSIWDGHWHMSTGTYDGSMVRLYVDGVQIGTGAIDPAGSINYSQPKALFVGDYQTGGGANFSGGIDEMQLYNRALSDSEILDLFKSYTASGPLCWWQASDNANDTLGTNHGVLAGSASYGSDPLGSGSAFKTQNGSVQISDSMTLQPTNVAVQAWVRCLSPGNDKYIISKSYTSSSASYAFSTGPGGGLEFCVTVGSGKVVSPAMGTSIWDGLYHLVDGIYDGQKVRLFVDGTEVGSGTAATGGILYGTSQSAGKLILGDFSDVPAGANFPGYIDEVKIYSNVVLALQKMPVDFDDFSSPIIIFTQPKSQSVNPGANLTLSVSAESLAARIYQWTFYGTNLPGATASTLSLTNIHSAQAGPYNVRISVAGLDYTNGAVGQAFRIGGSGGLLRIPNDPAFATDNFTVQLWAKSTAPGDYKYLLSKSRDAVAYNSSYALYTVPGGALTWAVALTNADEPTYHVSYFTTVAGTALWDNNWHQISGTWDGQFLALYVDGVLAQSVDTGGSTNIFYKNDFLDGDIVLGDVAAPTTPFHFPGSLDEVKYFNHALTTDAVMNSYTNGTAGTNGLVGWWRAENNFFDSVGPNYGLPLPPSGSVVSSTAVVTLIPAVFGNTIVVGGDFQTTLSGPTGGSYIIQSSSNLANWVSVATNTIPFTFSQSVSGSGAKFYRAVANLP